MLKLKLQYFGQVMRRTDSTEKTLIWERLKAGGKGDDRGWDRWMASPTWWTWVWESSRSWWWKGSLACSPWGHNELTWMSNWIELKDALLIKNLLLSAWSHSLITENSELRELGISLFSYCLYNSIENRNRKTSISALLTMPKPLTVWITINCGKFWKRWEYQTTWPVSWETCIQVQKQQWELDMEQQTGSK